MDNWMMKELAYELYKQDWIDGHTTPEMRLRSMQQYYEDFLSTDVPYPTYEEYLQDVGFDGNIYACFEEFVANEYENEEYMKYLLGDEIYAYFIEAEREVSER